MSRRSTDMFMNVVGVNGAKIEILVDANEYKKVLDFCKSEMGDNFPYVGTNADGKFYRLMLGPSTLSIHSRVRRTHGVPREHLLTMRLVHMMGGEVSFTVTQDEYTKVLTYAAEQQKKYGSSDTTYHGHDSSGNEYFVTLGRKTFSLDVTDFNND